MAVIVKTKLSLLRFPLLYVKMQKHTETHSYCSIRLQALLKLLRLFYILYFPFRKIVSVGIASTDSSNDCARVALFE